MGAISIAKKLLKGKKKKRDRKKPEGWQEPRSYKLKLEKERRRRDDQALDSILIGREGKKNPKKIKDMSDKRIEKEIKLLKPDLTMEERADLLGGYKEGGPVKIKDRQYLKGK
tara:strand:+ start:199 stop:537 length:339 start_codon:yes stop_codon:yes gene_type:complete